MLSVKDISEGISQLFYPHLCAGCGTSLINNNQLICIHCLHQLPLTGFADHADNPIEKMFWGRTAIHQATAHFYFTRHSALQQMLHQFKYKGRKKIGLQLGKMMGETLIKSSRFKNIDALIPMPLFASREKKRGYNQAAVLCEGISSVSNIPVIRDAVLRSRLTDTQTKKTRIQRWQNMTDRFVLRDPDRLQNNHLLLVDDVITTGATLEACVQTILKTENIQISIACLALTAST